MYMYLCVHTVVYELFLFYLRTFTFLAVVEQNLLLHLGFSILL